MGLDLFHVRPAREEIQVRDYFEEQELSGNPGFLERYADWLCTIDTQDGRIRVLHYSCIGFQRKQMKAGFYREFENNRLYFDVQSVKNAVRFLEAWCGESQQELIANFNRNFIENFVEGKSVFFPNW